MPVYKNISGQALHIGNKIVKPFDTISLSESSNVEEKKAIEKALKEGLLLEQITEVKPKKNKQPLNEDK